MGLRSHPLQLRVLIMIETIPEGFISDPAVLEVVRQFGGLQVGDEIVLGGNVVSEFQYAVVRVVAVVSGRATWVRTISAPNDSNGYAMYYASRDASWYEDWGNVKAWRRPV